MILRLNVYDYTHKIKTMEQLFIYQKPTMQSFFFKFNQLNNLTK